MFSWSQGGKRQSSSGSNQYPGRRISRNGNAAAHTPVEGSIRPSSSTELTRAQHLQSYLEDGTLSPSTRRVSSDDTTYQTVFQTTQGTTLIIKVNLPLPSSYSPVVPAMILPGVEVRHPWVEPRHMRITGYDPIQSETAWKNSKLSLGQAVHAVVQHLQLNPPEIIAITDQRLLSMQPQTNGVRTPPRSGNSIPEAPTSNGSNPPGYSTVRKPQLPPPPTVSVPTIPRSFPQLEEMSREQLDALLEDELEFLSLVHNLETCAEIQTIATSKINENAQLAEENLAFESRLQSVRTEIGNLQQTLQQKVDTFQQLEREQNALCVPPDEKSILRELNKAKREAFESSEAFAEDWVEDGSSNVDAFVKEFIAQRKVHHQRAAKMEILQNSKQTI